MNDAIKMQLSAFVDGELPDNESELLLRRMSQDAELRRDVAEYLAIGRFMRSEPGLTGADRLHERIAAAIDDRKTQADADMGAPSASRAVRPLAGIAIAATVALLAIFALQQSTGIDDAPIDLPVPVANEGIPSIDAQLERQRQFFRNHSESSSQLGANDLISRVVTMRISEEDREETDEAEESEVSSTDEAAETPSQP